MSVAISILRSARAITLVIIATASAASPCRAADWAIDFRAGLPPPIREAYAAGNWSSALSLARPLAEQGHPQAQTLMGLLSYYGSGVPQNDKEAARWYSLAAKQGEPAAQSNLGDMYDAGRGVAKDHSKALELWGRAAEKGHTVAMANIGLMHAEGIGVEANICQAYNWWRKAAALGGGIGQFNIGTMFERGDGVPRDDLQAYIWTYLAVEYMEPGQDRQSEGAVSQRRSLGKKMDPTQLKRAEQVMREHSLMELEASLPPCTP